MKIVFLQDDFPPISFGGAGISTFELARAVQAAGHEVAVITTCRKESEAGESLYEGLAVYKIASSYPGQWRAYVSINNRKVVRQVETILERLKPDVVHANNIHAHLSYASLSAAKRHARVVAWTARDTMSVCYGKLDTKRYLGNLDARTTWLDHIAQGRKRWNPLRNFFIKQYLGYADLKFAVSDVLRQALEDNGIVGVETIHTGMDVSAWTAGPDVAKKFKETHKLENKQLLFFGGRLSAEKGGGAALEALSLIAQSAPHAVLLVAGVVDDFARAMQTEARKLGVEERVVYTGWIAGKDLQAAYAASDVVLVPSIYLDPLPRVVLEGMAAGKPVVGSRYGGSPEAIVDGETGYIVDPRYPDRIAEKLRELLTNPQKAQALGVAGRERILRQFNLEAQARRVIDKYEKVITLTKD